MMRRAHLGACLTLLIAAAPAVAQAQARAGAAAGADAWVSYRDAYRAMVLFEKYGGPKHLLQNHLQVQPQAKGVLGEGAGLVLNGKTVQTTLPLDATGRATLPLLKAAYDENAVLAPNRALGPFALRARVTLAPRADGAYEAAELRAGCEQALAFARHTDATARSRQCAGVRLVFPKKGAEAAVRVRAGGTEQVLPVARGAAFAGDADDDFPVVTYRFNAQGAAQGVTSQLVTYNAPLAIVPLFE
ncbi:hypothetical protein [Massilia sp. YIM B02443]|uniref:hypothetical protein n=1 Tax=Massilia sp. YIM B02443 TaxID=3050127 RepID=UPI0025B6E1AE|nr:hypothetical protein [Massilia sp. YIM B02443]MDN4036677.1 hypothetical protein [Massilia sp. YIM B02443]